MQFDGYCIELLHDIQKILNFEYEIYEVEDGRYGVMNDNYEWNGMIRELVDKASPIIVIIFRALGRSDNIAQSDPTLKEMCGVVVTWAIQVVVLLQSCYRCVIVLSVGSENAPAPETLLRLPEVSRRKQLRTQTLLSVSERVRTCDPRTACSLRGVIGE